MFPHVIDTSELYGVALRRWQELDALDEIAELSEWFGVRS